MRTTAAASSPCVQTHDQLTGPGASRGRRQAGQHALELAGRHLAGAAAAGGVLGEPDFRRVVVMAATYVPQDAPRPSLPSRVTAEAFLVW